MLIYIRRLVGFTWTGLGAAFACSALVTAAAAAVPAVMVLLFGEELSRLQTTLAAAGAVTGWAAALSLTAPPLAAEIQALLGDRMPRTGRRTRGRAALRCAELTPRPSPSGHPRCRCAAR